MDRTAGPGEPPFAFDAESDARVAAIMERHAVDAEFYCGHHRLIPAFHPGCPKCLVLKAEGSSPSPGSDSRQLDGTGFCILPHDSEVHRYNLICYLREHWGLEDPEEQLQKLSLRVVWTVAQKNRTKDLRTLADPSGFFISRCRHEAR